ncbi:hypothetical protein ACFPRL_22015 [Pseudoclavibacter helvolus]
MRSARLASTRSWPPRTSSDARPLGDCRLPPSTVEQGCASGRRCHA